MPPKEKPNYVECMHCDKRMTEEGAQKHKWKPWEYKLHGASTVIGWICRDCYQSSYFS